MPPNKTAVVFEPHNDDFVIGMGGTGLQLLRAGWEVHSVVLTDGRLGSSTLSPAETTRVRSQEKEREASRTGMHYVELGYPDQGLQAVLADPEASRDATERVADIVDEHAPAVVFAPAKSDSHPDHMAANEIVSGAIERGSRDRSFIEYTVWNVPFPSVGVPPKGRILLVDIDDTLERKLDLIRVHASQLEEYPYDEIATRFNEYLGHIYRPYAPPSYVELFHVGESQAIDSAFLEDTGAEDVTDKFHQV